MTTYSWIRHCAGLVAKNPKEFQLFILYSDDSTPIPSCPNLCRDALYVQRTDDLFKICKELGIKKVVNLNINVDEWDIYDLSTKLQLSILIGGVNRIIYQYDIRLNSILVTLHNVTGVQLLAYNIHNRVDFPTLITNLSKYEVEQKLLLNRYMIGSYDKEDLVAGDMDEVLYKIRNGRDKK